MNKVSHFAAVMRQVWRQAPALFVFSFLANMLLLASAIYMLQVYDRVLSSGSLDTLVWLTLAAIGAIAVYGLLEQARRLILGRISEWLDDQLNGPVIRRAMEERLAGSGSDAGLRDVSDLRGFVGGDGIVTFLDAPWSPIFIAVLWMLHPAIGAIATLGAALLFSGALANEVLTRRKQQEVSAQLRRSQRTAGQMIDSAETIRSLGMADAMLRRWQERQQTFTADQQQLVERTTTIGNVSRSLRLALQVAVLGAGAYYVLAGQLTPGAMIAGAIILSRALAPIERSIGAWRSFVAARAAHRNLSMLFADDAPPTDVVRLPRPEGRLSVENLHCVAPGTPSSTGKYLLRKVSLELEPGETCAVIGPSGCGKSTLCRLLVGTWKPAVGHVRLDSAEVSGWPPDQLGQHVGYLPQHIELFPGTIAENIARLRVVDSGQVLDAAQRAGVHEMILRLPNGYQTDVGIHGARISGGQRQRIVLARALFGEPSLVVLDEPNSNLDSDGEQALIRALSDLKERGCTVVVVTHQANLLRVSDRILALHDGRVVTFGPRNDVLKALSGRPQKTVPAASEPNRTDATSGAPAMAAE